MIDGRAIVSLRLEHPDLDFWVDVRLWRAGTSWLAVADLAGTPEPVAASSPHLALLLALWPLGDGSNLTTQSVTWPTVAMYAGFTGSTGGATETTRVTGFSMTWR